MSIGGGARFRLDGRTQGQMRPVNVQMDVQKWATASLIWKQGDTHVLCAATVDDRVPPFLRGKGVGWVTAEYAMLPTATSERMQRESVKGKLGGQPQDIVGHGTALHLDDGHGHMQYGGGGKGRAVAVQPVGRRFGIGGTIDNVRQQWPTGQRLQHFWQAGSHSGPLSGRENDDAQAQAIVSRLDCVA